MRGGAAALLEWAHELGDGETEEEVLDGVLALGKAYARIQEFSGCMYCYERAKQGYDWLLGEDHAKSVEATYGLIPSIR